MIECLKFRSTKKNLKKILADCYKQILSFHMFHMSEQVQVLSIPSFVFPRPLLQRFTASLFLLSNLIMLHKSLRHYISLYTASIAPQVWAPHITAVYTVVSHKSWPHWNEHSWRHVILSICQRLPFSELILFSHFVLFNNYRKSYQKIWMGLQAFCLSFFFSYLAVLL